VLDPEIVTATVDSIIKSLAAEGIEARHLWKPMHLQPVFENERTFANRSAERLFGTGVTLPSGSILTDGDVPRVVDAIRSALV